MFSTVLCIIYYEASKKDRIESLETKLTQNRGHMTKEVEKLEKWKRKLKLFL